MKIQLNDDGTIGVPLTGLRKGEIVTCREPTLVELAEMNEWAAEADTAWDAMSKAQQTTVQYTAKAPYVVLFVRFMELLGEEAVEWEADGSERVVPAALFAALQPWVSSPRAAAAMTTYFSIPLDGEGLLRLARR